MTLVIALVIIVFAAGFHAYWAFGGQLGFSVSLPSSQMAGLSWRIACRGGAPQLAAWHCA